MLYKLLKERLNLLDHPNSPQALAVCSFLRSTEIERYMEIILEVYQGRNKNLG